MEIDDGNFGFQLPWVLYEISCSIFVAIDLELSGIPLKMRGNLRVGHDAQTNEERYAEVKDAAKRYQILQIGLTTCREDKTNGTYVVKPYNLNLSPIMDRGLNRECNFNGWTTTFLMNNNFDFNKMFKSGVRYFSREEEQMANAASEKSSSPWLPSNSLKIPHPSQNQDLTKEQKWLVHSLVEYEFPLLMSRTRFSCVEVLAKVTDGVDQYLEDQTKKLNSDLSGIRKSIGARWLFEALAGGDMSSIPTHVFSSLNVTKVDGENMPASKVESIIKERLRTPPILVGHNCFLDLVYLYQCFVGELPDTLPEFQARIHHLFPMVVDTKYLATQETGERAGSSLEDVTRALAEVKFPQIDIHSLHCKYLFGEHGVKKKDQCSSLQGLQLISAEIPDIERLTDDLKEYSNKVRLHEKLKVEAIVSDEDSVEFVETWAHEGAYVFKDSDRCAVPYKECSFWGVYGNRLCTFGTVEKIIEL
ncbi:hypothetical protein N7495_006422 [Penicillium taxi]|uniref:uncharacterized protein n=1 Tax=Penicillium taxi TaxID=168475 RepID=UPI0025453101|nr:uncharacterized protein N7495_006422 [Penicillium taxi]KAJ5894731.1 hypothetical protein N7495_006422 [Penicillium taxi]